jgi:ABC-type multidrug transport system fused ATPase/permease subunit
MTEPLGRFSAMSTIGRGLEAAPALRQGLGVTWLLAAGGAMGRLVVPILIQLSVDHGIRGVGDVRVGYVAVLVAIGGLCVALAAISQRQAVIRLAVRSEQSLYDLRVRLIEHIHRLSLADHNDERRGALVARITSDVETLAQFFQWGGLAWLLDGTLMLLVAGVMLAYDWILALVAFAVAMPLAFVLRMVQRHLVRAYDATRERNGEMLGSITELVAGSATIRAYEGAEHVAGRTRESVHTRADAQVRTGVIGAFLFPSGEVFSVLTIGAVVGIGVLRGPDGSLTAGAMIGFLFLTYRFLEPIAEFTEVLDQTQAAVAGLRRVLAVLDMPIGPPPPRDPLVLPAGAFDIDVHDVDFAYRGGDTVLRNVTLHIPAGQQVALVGATGSGKTTLGRLLVRLADPTSGSITLGGVPIDRIGNDELRDRVVVVSQEPFLFDASILENVAFARPGATYDDVVAVVERLELGDWIASFDEGLATGVGERGDELSAGERQLVALLRAGLADPDLLVLDEATSSVDAVTEVRISRALARLSEGRTTIAIAHRLSTAARADRVIVLDRGRVVEDGRHQELIAVGGPYSRLYDDWVSATSML